MDDRLKIILGEGLTVGPNSFYDLPLEEQTRLVKENYAEFIKNPCGKSLTYTPTKKDLEITLI